jgi:hypothetical protein
LKLLRRDGEAAASGHYSGTLGELCTADVVDYECDQTLARSGQSGKSFPPRWKVREMTEAELFAVILVSLGRAEMQDSD